MVQYKIFFQVEYYKLKYKVINAYPFPNCFEFPLLVSSSFLKFWLPPSNIAMLSWENLFTFLGTFFYKIKDLFTKWWFTDKK